MISELMNSYDALAIEGIRMRRATEDDWDALHECYHRAFGGVRTKNFDVWKQQFQLNDIAIAEDISDPDAPFIVGTGSVLRTSVTVPGGAQLSAAALCQGMVATTHQKRGLYGKVQAEVFAMTLEGGADVMAAMPGPGASYGAVGVTSYVRHLHIDRRRAKLRKATADSRTIASRTTGVVELPNAPLARETRLSRAVPHLHEVYKRWHEGTPGALSRSEFWWPSSFTDDSCVITHPDGYVIFDLVGRTVVVQDFCAVTALAHRERLRCLLAHGEYTDIRLDCPVDDPTPLMLEEAREAAVVGIDKGVAMWILNVAKAMQLRSYRGDYSGVIEIADPWGMTGGLFHLQVNSGLASWDQAPAGAQPDIRFSPTELASLYFGAHTASEFTRSGMVTELTPGAAVALDQTLATDRRPYNATSF